MESFRGICRGHPTDSKAPGQTHNCKTEQQRSRIDFAPIESLGEKRAAHAPDDDRKKSPEFEYPIAPRKPFLWKQLRQQTVLGRPKARALRADQKDGHQRQFYIGSLERC